MNFRCSNLLVTGGAGFIGSNFLKFISLKYPDLNIINLDKLTYASDLNYLSEISTNKNYNFIKGDICDSLLLRDIFYNYKIDGVINFAAETHVDNSILNPEIFVKSNINGVYNLLQNCYNFWMKSPFKTETNFKNARFHQISTDEIYGSIDDGSFNEASNYMPNSPYSASKASADMLVRSFNKTYGLNTTISVSSNNFGSNQNIEKFIPKVINSILNNESIIIYGDGKNVRDWLFVDDHCKAIDLIFNNAHSGEIYNVGAKNEITNIDLVEIIFQIISQFTERQKIIKFVDDRHGHDLRYSLNIDKIKSELNWTNSRSFHENLTDYIKKIIYGHNNVG